MNGYLRREERDPRDREVGLEMRVRGRKKYREGAGRSFPPAPLKPPMCERLPSIYEGLQYQRATFLATLPALTT